MRHIETAMLTGLNNSMQNPIADYADPAMAVRPQAASSPMPSSKSGNHNRGKKVLWVKLKATPSLNLELTLKLCCRSIQRKSYEST